MKIRQSPSHYTGLLPHLESKQVPYLQLVAFRVAASRIPDTSEKDVNIRRWRSNIGATWFANKVLTDMDMASSMARWLTSVKRIEESWNYCCWAMTYLGIRLSSIIHNSRHQYKNAYLMNLSENSTSCRLCSPCSLSQLKELQRKWELQDEQGAYAEAWS